MFEFLRFQVINSINQRYISLEVFFASFGEMAPHEFFKGTAKQKTQIFQVNKERREEKSFQHLNYFSLNHKICMDMAQVSSKLHAQIEKVRDIIGRELTLMVDQ